MLKVRPTVPLKPRPKPPWKKRQQLLPTIPEEVAEAPGEVVQAPGKVVQAPGEVVQAKYCPPLHKKAKIIAVHDDADAAAGSVSSRSRWCRWVGSDEASEGAGSSSGATADAAVKALT